MQPVYNAQVVQHVNNWIDKLSIPQEKLGGYSVCPFAQAAKNKIQIYSCDNLIKLTLSDIEFEIIIFLLPKDICPTELINQCEAANKKWPNLIFLPDHKDRRTTINTVETNNGIYNFVLCQSKEKLKNARKKLYKTTYYSFWDREYLEEILGEDIVNLD